LTARDHIQGKILDRRDGRLRVNVVTVFRGSVRPGTELTLFVSVADDGPPMPGARIALPASTIDAARYIEAFLDGEPPEVVRDQIRPRTMTDAAVRKRDG
jgi:hypothetical protein